MLKYSFIILLSLLFFGGCKTKPKYTDVELELMPLPQRQGLPEISGGLVLTVGTETITAEGIITPMVEHFKPVAQATDFEQFKKQARPQLSRFVTTSITNIVLYQLAQKDLGEDIDTVLDQAVETEVRKFLVSHENDYSKAEQFLEQMGMDWKSFREYQKKRILTQSYVSSQLPEPEPITYSEMIARYNYMKAEYFFTPAMLTFRLIDIQPAKINIGPDEDRMQKAKSFAEELVGQIHEGKDFAELAKQYSHGHRAMFGGLWKPVQPDSLAKPYDLLATEAEKIDPNEIAGPIEAGEHIFIIKLEEKHRGGIEPFENVQDQVEEQIKFLRYQKGISKIETEVAQQTAVSNKEEFIDFCLEIIYQMSNE